MTSCRHGQNRRRLDRLTRAIFIFRASKSLRQPVLISPIERLHPGPAGQRLPSRGGFRRQIKMVSLPVVGIAYLTALD
jgi:hypothetical protein